MRDFHCFEWDTNPDLESELLDSDSRKLRWIRIRETRWIWIRIQIWGAYPEEAQVLFECTLTEYVKWFWASPDISTGEPLILCRTFWEFAGHFMSGKKENFRRTFLTFSRYFRQRIEFLCRTFCSISSRWTFCPARIYPLPLLQCTSGKLEVYSYGALHNWQVW